MWKEALAVGCGIVAGVALCYGGYRLYKYLSENKTEENKDVFAVKLKEKEEQEQRLRDLIANQTYVELLTVKELTNWFRANRDKVMPDAKMIIITPTGENLKGLGFSSDNDIDVDTNVVQLFYDDDSGKVLLIRLVNYTDIDSNLQAQLIEQDGMIIVTD